MPDSAEANRIEDAFKKYSFYHSIEIMPGVVTPGEQLFEPIQKPIMAELQRQDMRGKRVLDIGCRDGLFAFEAERMGAMSILGIDNDISAAATDFIIPFMKSMVEMRSLNLYDLAPEHHGPFDFVIFCGVLYHLRFPFLGIERVADVMAPNATLLLETALWMTPNPLPLLYCPRPEDSPYEPTSVTFYNHPGIVAALETAGLHEVE